MESLSQKMKVKYMINPDKKSRMKWPWDVEIGKCSGGLSKSNEYPKITIVTPSYNQGEFIEETIRSVILQNYPNLEYIIIDGGSTDNTVEIIKKYEDWIDFWISEPDKGQSDAINKGFERATGMYGNWINSDDLLVKDALFKLTKYIDSEPEKLIFLGKCIQTEKDLTFRSVNSSSIRSVDDLVHLEEHWGNNPISQQNVLFRINEFRRVGGLKVNNHYAMDYELWGDLLLNGNKIVPVDFEVGIFRRYEGQKISDRWKTVNCLINSAHKLVLKNREWGIMKKILLTKTLLKYRYKFIKQRVSFKTRFNKIMGRDSGNF